MYKISFRRWSWSVFVLSWFVWVCVCVLILTCLCVCVTDLFRFHFHRQAWHGAYVCRKRNTKLQSQIKMRETFVINVLTKNYDQNFNYFLLVEIQSWEHFPVASERYRVVMVSTPFEWHPSIASTYPLPFRHFALMAALPPPPLRLNGNTVGTGF